MDRSNFRKLSAAVYTLAGVLMLVALIWLGWMPNTEVVRNRPYSGFTYIKNAVCREVSDSSTPCGIRKEYTWQIPEISNGDTCIAVYTVHQYVKIYIDGQLEYSRTIDAEHSFGQTIGSSWVYLPLYPEDRGKEIRIDIIPVYRSSRSREPEFLIGVEWNIFLHRLRQDLPQIVLSIAVILVGLLFAAFGVYSFFQKHAGQSLIARGVFSVMLGIWRLTDTKSSPMILPEKTAFLFYVSVCMLMLGIIPFLKSVQDHLSQRSKRVLDRCCVLVAGVSAVQLILQLAGIADIRETLPATHVTIVICALVLAAVILSERIRHPRGKIRHSDRWLPLLCGTGLLLDFAAYYIKGNSSGLVFTILAFLLYTIIASFHALTEYSEQEARIVENRITIMLSQIQPHFLFNSLTAIAQLCEQDPAQAKQTILIFARYLRGNLDALRQKQTIPFQKELDHLKMYLTIEKLRFGKDLQVEFSIGCTDFRIPALTVQPLVENAIQHGIRAKRGGGTVTVSTCEESDQYRICICDDGVGFTPGELPADGRQHVGIENVRRRLDMMCSASLVIESAPGQGTTAIISIPKGDL